MDFDVDRKMEEIQNDGNTMLLSSVLDQLLTNPYDVELQGQNLSTIKMMNYT